MSPTWLSLFHILPALALAILSTVPTVSLAAEPYCSSSTRLNVTCSIFKDELLCLVMTNWDSPPLCATVNQCLDYCMDTDEDSYCACCPPSMNASACLLWWNERSTTASILKCDKDTKPSSYCRGIPGFEPRCGVSANNTYRFCANSPAACTRMFPFGGCCCATTGCNKDMLSCDSSNYPTVHPIVFKSGADVVVSSVAFVVFLIVAFVVIFASLGSTNVLVLLPHLDV